MNSVLSKNVFGNGLRVGKLQCSKQAVIGKPSSVFKVPTQYSRIQSELFSTKKPSNIAPKATSLPFKFLGEGNQAAAKAQPAPVDTSASVYFQQPPSQYEEDKDAASYLGVNQFFRSGGLSSFYILKFEPLKNTPLDSYIESAKLDFYSKVPYGSISRVELAPELTSHLGHVQNAALFFDKRRVPKEFQRPAELSVILKTPGGFWNVACHSTFFNLSSQKDHLIGAMLQNLRVDLKRKEEPVNIPVHTELGASSSNDMTKIEVTQADPSQSAKKRPNKIGKIAKQANVGNINLTNPKEEFSVLDDDGSLEY